MRWDGDPILVLVLLYIREVRGCQGDYDNILEAGVQGGARTASGVAQ